MHAIPSCRTSMIVKTKWTVICPGLRSTQQLINGIHFLSALLKGRAIDVYDMLSDEDAASYDKLKEALLKNFDMTERGFRKKFRYSRPENKETFIQLSSRLNSYLSKRLAMAKVEKTVCDFMARKQSCDRELYVH